jgi:N-terminal domain of anti-restriction factor ArdC
MAVGVDALLAEPWKLVRRDPVADLSHLIFALLRAAVEAAQARSRRAPPNGAVMPRKSSRRRTEPQRAERRRQDRERLQTAAEQLLTSDGWKRWVRVRSQAGLARLSISNQLLVALARPDATFVAGFNTWIRLGYAVRKGERAVAIIAKRAILHRMRSRPIATSVLPGGV